MSFTDIDHFSISLSFSYWNITDLNVVGVPAAPLVHTAVERVDEECVEAAVIGKTVVTP